MAIKYLFAIGLQLASIPTMAGSIAAQLTKELSSCAVIVDEAARLDCYDRLAADPQLRAIENKNSASKEAVQHEPASPPDHGIGETQTVAAEIHNRQSNRRWLGIRPYRRNYILPVTYNSHVNLQPFESADVGFRPEDVEVKFQISAELPLWENILTQDLDLYFAYTQLSFFQAYNSEYSSPFRDTSYEPEIGLNWHPGLSFMDWQLKSARIALNHQSNGRAEPLSRSWNRLVGQIQANRDNLDLGLRVWKRLPENEEDDDNPDITDFLGYGEFFADYELGRHQFGIMLRNPLQHTGMQLNWNYPINRRVSFYAQYFNGYGESLIDYDHRVNRIGVGFLLNEW